MTYSYMENIGGISKELHQRGFRVETILDDDSLPEKLVPYCLKYARGIYQAIRIVPNELTEFEGENLNGPGIWRPAFPGHVLYTRPNVEHREFQGKLEINVVFRAVKIPEGDEEMFFHFSSSVHELKRDFPQVYGKQEEISG